MASPYFFSDVSRHLFINDTRRTRSAKLWQTKELKHKAVSFNPAFA
uniref:Uncharacterized protein n=1 Tax=Anguilla anguilla TaxID=7936 RepID=A0A0E9WB92_ANGAN